MHTHMHTQYIIRYQHTHTYLSIYLSIHPSIYLSIYLSIFTLREGVAWWGGGRKVKTLLSLLSWYNFNLLVLRSYSSLQLAFWCYALNFRTQLAICSVMVGSCLPRATCNKLCDVMLLPSLKQQSLWWYALFSQATCNTFFDATGPSTLISVVSPWFLGGVVVSRWYPGGGSMVSR